MLLPAVSMQTREASERASECEGRKEIAMEKKRERESAEKVEGAG